MTLPRRRFLHLGAGAAMLVVTSRLTRAEDCPVAARAPAAMAAGSRASAIWPDAGSERLIHIKAVGGRSAIIC